MGNPSRYCRWKYGWLPNRWGNIDPVGIGHRFKKLPPPPGYVTKDEVKVMIDDAIRKHNRNAGIISMFVGFFILGLFC